MRNPVLVLDPFYILPSKLLDHCMKVLPVGNTLHQAVCVDTGSSGDAGPTAVMEIIQIKDVGSFSRPQIQLMKKIDCLKAIVQQGTNTHKWILEEGLSALPAQYHYLAKQVADEVMNTYPYKNINGLSGSNELVYSMLYRAVPPAWLSDACIRGLAIRLVADNPSARFAGFQTVTTGTSRARAVGELLVSSDVLVRLIHQIAEMGVETALLALNFHNAHWCCIVVKVTDKRIFYYDPLNQKPYMRAAKEVATYLKHNGLAEYDVVSQNNPVQFDQMSCGVFVCWIFMRKVVHGLTHDMNDNCLAQRRFELFYYILTGHLIAPIKNTPATSDVEMQQAPLEDRDPTPTQDELGGESLPPTQAAG